MADRLRRGRLDLFLHGGGGRRLVDENAELVVVDEEAACGSIAVLLERNGLDRQIEDLIADKHTNETKQTTCRGTGVLGSVLHNRERKHQGLPRKA